MTKVYCLAEGEYSDYGIVGVFSTLEKAIEAAKIRKAEEAKFGIDWRDYDGVIEVRELDKLEDLEDPIVLNYDGSKYGVPKS